MGATGASSASNAAGDERAAGSPEQNREAGEEAAMALTTTAGRVDIAARPHKSQLSRQRVRAAWMFLVPMLLVLVAVAGWPLLRTIYFGFTNASLDDLGNAKWVGFKNYLEWVDYGDGTGEWFGL